MQLTNGETFDLVMGELDESGCILAPVVVEEGLSREQAVTALEAERASQLSAPDRDFGVTELDGDCFELVGSRGQAYRRYFLERAS